MYRVPKSTKQRGKIRARKITYVPIKPQSTDIYTSARRAIKKYGPTVASLAGGALTKSIMSFISGFGDYSIKGNSIMDNINEPPIVSNAPGNGVIIRHREYIADISATTAFTTSSYTINPGDSATFPWLSQIASSFEQYRVRGMLFYFNSLSSPNVLAASATTALGAVIMATQYDVEDNVFADKREMENYEFANSRVPYKSFIHPIECARSQTVLSELYVRDYISDGNDPRFYDLGRFVIATTGMQANTGVVGELWVTYEIEFLKPKIFNLPRLSVDHYFTSTGVAGATPLGTAITLQSGSNLGSTITLSTRTITLPATALNHEYEFSYAAFGTAAALVDFTVTIAGGTATMFYAGAAASSISNTGTTSAWYFRRVHFTVTSTACTITLGNGGTLPTNVTALDVMISVLPEALSISVEKPPAEIESDSNEDESRFTLTLAQINDIICNATNAKSSYHEDLNVHTYSRSPTSALSIPAAPLVRKSTNPN